MALSCLLVSPDLGIGIGLRDPKSKGSLGTDKSSVWCGWCCGRVRPKLFVMANWDRSWACHGPLMFVSVTRPRYRYRIARSKAERMSWDRQVVGLERLMWRTSAPEIVRDGKWGQIVGMSCLLYTSPSPRDATLSRMPSSA